MTVVSDYTALISGESWWGFQAPAKPVFIAYSFETSPQAYLAERYSAQYIASFQAFDESEKALARQALAQWGNACGVTFFEAPAGQGDIRFAQYDFSYHQGQSEFGAYAYYPNVVLNADLGSDDAIAGDVFVNTDYPTTLGVLLHEIGHALGLKHPFEDDPTLASNLDHSSHTVMAYDGPDPNVLGHLDIDAARALYGLPTADGTQVASWSWNAATYTLTQAGGAAADVIRGISTTDVMAGNGGDDILFGSFGNDRLDGGAGADRLFGGGGSDTMVGGPGDDFLEGLTGYAETDSGVDTADYSAAVQAIAVDLRGSFIAGRWVHAQGADIGADEVWDVANVIGGAGADAIRGDILANVLSGGSGNDALSGAEGADVLAGGLGNDVLVGGAGGDALDGGAGLDQAQYQGAGSVTADLLTPGLNAGEAAGDSYISIEGLRGTLAGDILRGDNNANTIEGGGGGNDSLLGRGGDDTLVGSVGNDTLDGGADADAMAGGGGNDFYYVDNAGDVTTEISAGGSDRVFSALSCALAAGAEIETFTTTNAGGASAINLTGNAFGQSIVGNAGANIIDGKAGADVMQGLGGNDWYHVDSASDRAVEAAGGGADRVLAAVSFALEAGAEVETLVTTNNAGASAINLTGNAFAQTIVGNAGANFIDGKAGADMMQGLGGNDWYYVDSAGDRAIEAGGGADRVLATASFALEAGAEIEILKTVNDNGASAIDLTGNAFANTIVGNAGANVLNGGAGVDTFLGLGGADTFFFNSALNAATNVDHIADYDVAADTMWLDNVVFTALSTTGALAASAFFVGAAAADASDRIIYNNTTGALIYDANGAGAGGATQFASLRAGLAMTNADFVVV